MFDTQCVRFVAQVRSNCATTRTEYKLGSCFVRRSNGPIEERQVRDSCTYKSGRKLRLRRSLRPDLFEVA